MGARDVIQHFHGPEIIARFWSKVEVKGPNRCWVWRHENAGPYPKFRITSESVRAHVIAYFYAKGNIPHGFMIDHECRNKRCVNPNHLRAVPARVNAVQNNTSPIAINAAKKFCKRGHELAGDNVYVEIDKKGSLHRRCIPCRAIYKRLWRRLREEA